MLNWAATEMCTARMNCSELEVVTQTYPSQFYLCRIMRVAIVFMGLTGILRESVGH